MSQEISVEALMRSYQRGIEINEIGWKEQLKAYNKKKRTFEDMLSLRLMYEGSSDGMFYLLDRLNVFDEETRRRECKRIEEMFVFPKDSEE